MKTSVLTGIPAEDYNSALFEAGCNAAETRYTPPIAALMKQSREYWNWLRTQRDVVDMNFLHRPGSDDLKKNTRQAFRVYAELLKKHLETVFLPERLEKQIMQGREK